MQIGGRANVEDSYMLMHIEENRNVEDLFSYAYRIYTRSPFNVKD